MWHRSGGCGFAQAQTDSEMNLPVSWYADWPQPGRYSQQARPSGARRREWEAQMVAAASAGAGPVSVFVVDDSYLFREGLRQILQLSARVEVTGVYESQVAVKAALVERRPAVVLCDIRMPPSWTDEGVRFAEEMRTAHPEVAVLLMSQETSAEYAAELLRHGAHGRGYLLKDRVHDLDHLVSSIVGVARGECRVDPTLIARLVSDRPSDSRLAALTPRQLQLLGDVAAGKSNQAIARERVLTLRAVEKHVSDIFARLDLAGDAEVNRRVRATLLFLDATLP